MTATLHTSLGPISVREDQGIIAALNWHAADHDATPLEQEALRQLDQYFARERTLFDLPLDYGTGLHEQVRRAMSAIPQGETHTYGDLARDLKVPAQSIGQACGANPVPILIPCHRILGAHSLGGFSAKGGVETKVWLLKHEGAASLLL